MTVHDAISRAEAMLPGVPAPEGETDLRWQAIIEVGEYIQTDPEPIWPFVARWGSSDEEDVRLAIATCLLEHLLEYHFRTVFPRVRALAESDPRFADTLRSCAKFGETTDPENAARFDALVENLRGWSAA